MILEKYVEHPMCSKCLSSEVQIRYHSGGDRAIHGNRVREWYCECRTHDNHLEHVCRTCHYKWATFTADRLED